MFGGMSHECLYNNIDTKSFIMSQISISQNAVGHIYIYIYKVTLYHSIMLDEFPISCTPYKKVWVDTKFFYGNHHCWM